MKNGKGKSFLNKIFEGIKKQLQSQISTYNWMKEF